MGDCRLGTNALGLAVELGLEPFVLSIESVQGLAKPLFLIVELSYGQGI